MKHKFLIAILLTTFRAASAETWYVDASVRLSGDGTSWKTAFKTIQGGIDAAYHRDTVIVAEGTYIENIQFKGKKITLTSTDPFYPPVVHKTVIDGKQAGSVVTFLGTEDKGCVLSGFTIRNGKAQSGGGIVGHGALASIRYNTITRNSADGRGGALYRCDGLIRNNTISGNWSASRGGGLSGCGGTIQSNYIVGNSAGSSGGGGGLSGCGGTIQNNYISDNTAQWAGGLFDCDGIIQNNTISGNWASRNGGGLSSCDGTIRNNDIITNSTEEYGGGLAFCHGAIHDNSIANNSSAISGGGLAACDGTIRNNTITGNSASSYGGGLVFCDDIIQNNAICGNSVGSYGGGLAYCEGTIQNCIIWGNTAGDGDDQLFTSSTPSYSCIQGWEGGEGNISDDPRFVDIDGPDNDPGTYEDNDYRPLADSPCIDAGINQSWMWEAVDLDGNPRIFHGGSSLTVDMGAYEYGFFAFRITELSRDISGQRQLVWNSRPGDTYAIWSCLELVIGPWIEEKTIASQGETTIWADPDTKSPRKFYRIEIR